MSYGLGPKGFKRKRYSDLVLSMQESAKNVFGENVNLSPISPLGVIISIVAWFTSQIWQVAEKVYNSSYVDTAEGYQLDHVAKYIGIRRKPAERATGKATFTGEDGTEIEKGFLVETEDEMQFQTTESGEIQDGNVTLSIRAIEPGTDGNVPANTITEIVNPIAGLDEVTNSEETTEGSEKETDSELRNRYERSVSLAGASTLDSIRASLLELENIRAATVIENNTIETDGDGRPPKSFESYVLDGDNDDIGNAIFGTKPAGIETYGDELVTVTDDAGNQHTVKFSFADEVTIYIDIQLTTNEEFPEDGKEQIVTDIVRFIGGTDEDGEVYAGLGMGENVRYSKVLRAIDVEGIEDIELDVSDDGQNYSKDNIEIGPTEVAETSYDKVVINIVE